MSFALRVACPSCKQPAGSPCKNGLGQYRSTHPKREAEVPQVKPKNPDFLPARNDASAKVKEHDIRELLKARIKAYGGDIRAVKWIGRSHAPDVLVLLPIGAEYEGYIAHGVGGHYFVETKRPGKDATEAQAREHERMRAAACNVLVITSEAELDEWFPPL